MSLAGIARTSRAAAWISTRIVATSAFALLRLALLCLVPPATQALPAPVITADGQGRVLVSRTSNHHLAVTRLSKNGGVDQGFGDGGVRRLPIHALRGAITGIRVNGAGAIDIVMINTSHCRGRECKMPVSVVQLTPDGGKDRAFGANGRASAVLVHSGGAGGLAFDASGNLYTAAYGFVNCPGSPQGCEYHQYIAKLTPGGTRDLSFGSGGVASAFDSSVPFGEFSFAGVTAIAVQPDGAVLASGASSFSSTGSIIVRFTDEGTPDPGFGGGDGIVRTPTPTTDLYPTPNGQILAGGAAGDCCPGFDGEVFGLQRFAINGSPDPTLQAEQADALRDRKETTARLAHCLPGGGAIVIGETFSLCGAHGCHARLSAVRLRPDGSRDETFGGGTHLLAALSDGEVNPTPARREVVDSVVVGERLYVATPPYDRDQPASSVVAPPEEAMLRFAARPCDVAALSRSRAVSVAAPASTCGHGVRSRPDMSTSAILLRSPAARMQGTPAGLCNLGSTVRRHGRRMSAISFRRPSASPDKSIFTAPRPRGDGRGRLG